MNQTMSPTINKEEEEIPKFDEELNFASAIAEILNSNKITKLEWDDQQYYAILHEGLLKLHKPDGQLYSWTLSEGDLMGEDYKIIN